MRALGLLAAALLLVGHVQVFDFVCDDAFISFRYAANLVEHGELVFNVGERVEGYTNFLWTVIMAAVLALGGDPVRASRGLALAAALGTLAVVARMHRRLEGRASRWDALAPLLLASSSAFACWTSGGLETALFTLLLTLAACLLLLPRLGAEASLSGTRSCAAGAIAGLASWARPEGVLFAGAAVLWSLVGWRDAGNRRAILAGVARFVAAFGAVYGPYFVWRFAYYGWLFPNTFYVKSGTALWGPGALYVFDFAVDSLPLIVLALAGWWLQTAKDRPNAGLRGLTALVSVAFSVHVARVGGDFMALHRYLVPVLPLLALASARGARAIAIRVEQAGSPLLRRVSLSAAALLAAGLLTQATLLARDTLEPRFAFGVDSVGLLRQYSERWTLAGRWFAEHAPPDRSMAITAAGAIPYYSGLRTLDIQGLNDVWIAHSVAPSSARPGHTREAPDAYILEQEIDFLLYHPNIADTPPEPVRPRWGRLGYRWRTVSLSEAPPLWLGFWEREPSARPQRPRD